jgi:sec-independent protein translocase protein TatA
MGSLSPWHLIIVALLLVVLFGGRGKLSSFMGDAAKGIKAFKDGLKEEPDAAKPAVTLPPAQPDKDTVVR